VRVTMILDNHYGPDRRVERETELLAEPATPSTSGLDGASTAPTRSSPRLGRPSTVFTSLPHRGRRALRGGGDRFWRRVWQRRRALVRGELVYVHDIYCLPLGAGSAAPSSTTPTRTTA